MNDKDSLAAAARAATPGPWEASVMGSEGYAVMGTRPGDRHRRHLARCGMNDWETDKANALFIAAADPTTVLGLLVENDRLRSAVRTALDFIEHHPAVSGQWPILVDVLGRSTDPVDLLKGSAEQEQAEEQPFAVGDRVTRRQFVHWTDSPIRHGTVTLKYSSAGYPELYEVRWDDGGLATGYLRHGLAAETLGYQRGQS